MPKLGFTRMGTPQGHPIVLIHGWGFDSSFLYPVAQLFTDRDVYLIDLPGYGKSVHLTSIASDFTRTIHLLINTIPYGADVIAWSFGTIYTLHALTEITNLSNDEDYASALKRHMQSQHYLSSPLQQQTLSSHTATLPSNNESSKQSLQGNQLNDLVECSELAELAESGTNDIKEQSYHSILDYCLNRNQHKTYFRSLVTICGSPRFPSDPNWQGMNAIKILKCNTKMTHHNIDLIMGLFRRMMRKTAIKQEDRAYIKQKAEKEQVSYDVLKEGIKVVTLMDERPAWQNLSMPSLHLFGALDPLVPCSLASLFKTPMHSSFVFPHSTHTPYLSEPKSFQKVIYAFFDKVTHLANSKNSESNKISYAL